MAERPAFSRTLRSTALAWVALLALMTASLGSAYVRLGAWNTVAGLGIAAVKCAIVVWLFMRMREAGPLIRLAGVAGLGVWAILVGLSGVDYGTRVITPAAVQRPRQLLPATAPAPAATPRRAAGAGPSS
jgi:cytochrome c oxidase subunit 4